MAEGFKFQYFYSIFLIKFNDFEDVVAIEEYFLFLDWLCQAL